MRAGFLSGLFCLVLAACGGGNEYQPYGPPLELKMDTPYGELRGDILPWDKAMGMPAKVWLATRRGDLSKAGKVKGDTGNFVKMRVYSDAWFIERELKRKRWSMLFACGDEDGKFIRFAEAYGSHDVFHKSKGTNTVDQIVEAVADACEQDPDSAFRAAIRADITTKPRKGNATGKIKYVLHKEKDSYAGDFMVINESTYALFKDKWAYLNPYVPLDDFDYKRSRELEPGKWRRWRKKGKKFYLRDPRDEDSDWSEIAGRVTRVKPLKKRQKFDGEFTYVRTSGSYAFGSSSTWRHYNFDKKGNYESSSSSIGGSGTMASIFPEMGSFTHVSNCSKDGGGTTSSMLHPAVTIGSSTKNDQCGDGKAGTYKIRGYTIELHANNGVVQRLPFYKVSDRKVFVSSRGYWKSEEEE